MRRIAWEDHTAHRGAVELESTGNSKKEHDMFNRFRFPARVRLIDGGSGEGGSGEGNEPEPKSFTQEQVDQIVERRLAKERGKYKDYDEFKSKAMRLDEMENAGKSELDKLKESNAALRKQIDDAAAEKQHAEWVSEVAKDKGVPAVHGIAHSERDEPGNGLFAHHLKHGPPRRGKLQPHILINEGQIAGRGGKTFSDLHGYLP